MNAGSVGGIGREAGRKWIGAGEEKAGKLMRVAMYYRNEDVRLEEMPKPRIGPGELLVKVIACGICGSDVMEWYRIKKAPLVLGHELAGEIEEAGEGVKGFRPGDRVMVTHHVPCNTCHYCLSDHHSVCDTLRSTNIHPGGFAQYARVPAINVERGTFPLPDDMSYEEATFLEPLACVVRGQRHALVSAGKSVLVVGSGMSGLMHVMLARAKGAGPIIATDVSRFKLQAARRAGAGHVLDATQDVPAHVKSHNGGRLADIVILCTSAASAVAQAAASVERGGTLLLFAPPPPEQDVPLPLWRYWKDEITVTTSYAGPPADIMEAMGFIRSGTIKVADLITHRLPLERTGEGFELVSQGRDAIKVIIMPNG